jgi:hypothetical protein
MHPPSIAPDRAHGDPTMKSPHPLKRDFVRYATEGGLRLWDESFTIRWHNLPADELADWAEFFDICRDEPTHYTEPVIAAIQAGLCPLKGSAFGEESAPSYWDWPPEGRKPEGFWYFVADREFKPPGLIPELSAPYPVTHYYQPALSTLIRVEDAFTRWARYARQDGGFVRIWRFKHLQGAWGFLLGRL